MLRQYLTTFFEAISEMTATKLLVMAGSSAIMLISVLLPAQAKPLRVCADPAYMPYTNKAGQGFENKIAELVAHTLHRKLEYTWASYRMQGGFDQFLATTLDAHKCDVVMEMPYGNIEELTTKPFYESAYVFVYRKDGKYKPDTMDSPAIKNARVGYVAGTPPETGLKLRGLVTKSTEFNTAGKIGESPATLLDAVKNGKVDIMLTWEPAIGYFMHKYPSLTMARIPNERATGSPEKYSFSIAMAVRQHDKKLAHTLSKVITEKQSQIKAILTRFNVKMPSANVSQQY